MASSIKAAAVAAAILLSGCETLDPSLYQMRFTSEPSGALVYASNGKAIGMTPMERSMVLSPEDRQRDSLTDVAIVVWPSGATLRQTITIWPRRNRIWNVSFSRPPRAPGLDVDLRHAMLQQQQQQRGDDVDALLGAFVGAYNAGRYQAAPVPLDPPASIRCTSRESGWSIVTTCR